MPAITADAGTKNTEHAPADEPVPDAVVCVTDACNLPRTLYVATEVMQTGLPTVIAINMIDQANAAGITIDCQKLTKIIGVPVIAISAATGEGIIPLQQALQNLPAHRTPRAKETNQANEKKAIQRANKYDDKGNDIVIQRYRYILSWMEAINYRNQPAAISQRFDPLSPHPFAGFVLFGALMWAVFVMVAIVADPLMGIFETLLNTPGDWVAGLIDQAYCTTCGLMALLPGRRHLGFVPQIALLIACLGLLERSGYLARATVLLDRPLQRIGLHGKSFVPCSPLHACAIPGIMSARSIESPRDRLATMLVAPLMACGARLPVYFLLIGFFFSHYSGFLRTILFALYLIGILAAVVIALLARRTLLPAE